MVVMEDSPLRIEVHSRHVMCERLLVTILTRAAPPSPSSKPTTSIGDKCQLRPPFIRNPPVRSWAISPKIERPVSAAPDWLADGRLPAHQRHSKLDPNARRSIR